MVMKLAGYLHEIDKAKAADSGVNAATERFHAASRELAEKVETDIQKALQGNGPFLDTELVYAAAFRCLCGAGMAYPDGIALGGAWYCSAILKGEARREADHNAAHPFAFYEVKSEDQPSAYGQTTRPSGSYVETTPWYVCKKCQHAGIGKAYKPGERKDIDACPECGAGRDDLHVRYFSTAYFDRKDAEGRAGNESTSHRINDCGL